MKTQLFRGACTALVTPFLDGKVNYPMLERLIARQIEYGIRTIVLCGTTGEASTLTDNEKIEIFVRARKFVGNTCTLIAGTGSNSTGHAVSLSVAAEDVQMDGLLVVTPYYNKATTDGLLAHYEAISQSVHIPLILYNVPSRTGVDIPVSAYRQLCKVPNIIGVKEASNDIAKIAKIIFACGPDFSVWSGNDTHAVPSISIGAKGVISVASNVRPAEVQAMCLAALDGDYDTAMTLHHRLLPLMETLFCEVNPIPVKAAMQRIGFDCGSCRLPLCDLSQENRNKLNSVL